MTFYIDIILIENMIMNYIILFATEIIIKVNAKQRRLVISSLLGSIYVIMSYISGIEIYMNQILKTTLSIVMVYIAFFPKNLKMLLKEIIIFYLTSFCFGGAAYYLLYYIKPVQINNINKILTGSYPIKIAILGGILGFFIIIISFKIIKNKIGKSSIFYNIDIGLNNKICSLKVILDTGNLLVEPITSSPVIIVEKEAIKEIISEDVLEKLLSFSYVNNSKELPEEIRTRCRFIPFSSIGKKNGMIIGIKPDYIKIHEEDNELIRKNVIVGISNVPLSKNGTYSGLIGLELLKNKIEKRYLCKNNKYFERRN